MTHLANQIKGLKESCPLHLFTGLSQKLTFLGQLLGTHGTENSTIEEYMRNLPKNTCILCVGYKGIPIRGGWLIRSAYFPGAPQEATERQPPRDDPHEATPTRRGQDNVPSAYGMGSSVSEGRWGRQRD